MQMIVSPFSAPFVVAKLSGNISSLSCIAIARNDYEVCTERYVDLGHITDRDETHDVARYQSRSRRRRVKKKIVLFPVSEMD